MKNNKESHLDIKELKTIYQVIRSFEEDLIINPSENWEQDYYNEALVNRKHLKNILKKIEEMLPKEEKEEMIKNLLRRKYSTFNNEIDEKVYDIIEKAFDRLKTVEIDYFDMESGEAKNREIDVYYKSRKYVIGYCHLKSAIRKFRTSRIVSAKITDKKYIIPEDFNKNNY